MGEFIDQIQPGWTAFGRDGDKIGAVEDVGSSYLLVAKGLIFVKDIYIPTDFVAEVDPDERAVHIDVDTLEVEEQGWSEPPLGDSGSLAASDLDMIATDTAEGGASAGDPYGIEGDVSAGDTDRGDGRVVGSDDGSTRPARPVV
jgi:hypothetical protein